MALSIKTQTRRWLIVAVLFLAILFNYIDRQIVSILKPVLKKEFHIDDPGYAFVVNVFTVCYGLMYPVGGWLTDRFGAKLTMFWGVIVWSMACIGGGFSRSISQLTFFRGMLGLAEPTNFPAQIKVVTIWFSGKIRATANSLCVAGSSVGAIIAAPMIAWLSVTYNWQTVFVCSGVAGLVIAGCWMLIYEQPPILYSEKELVKEANEEKAFTWQQLWYTKSLWGILLIRFVSDPVWYFCLFWLPGYLQEKSGLTLTQLGRVGWIPFLAADLGAIALSAWSDRMVKNGKPPLLARKMMLTVAALFAPLCALTPYLPNAASTLMVFSVVAIVCLCWLFNLSVVIAEAFPVKNVASVLGIAGGFGAAGAVLFNYYVGQFIGRIGAGKLFIVMAALHPIALILLWRMIRVETPAVVENNKTPYINV